MVSELEKKWHERAKKKKHNKVKFQQLKNYILILNQKWNLYRKNFSKKLSLKISELIKSKSSKTEYKLLSTEENKL